MAVHLMHRNRSDTYESSHLRLDERGNLMMVLRTELNPRSRVVTCSRRDTRHGDWTSGVKPVAGGCVASP